MFGRKSTPKYTLEELKGAYEEMVAQLREEAAAGNPDAVTALEGEMKTFNPVRVAKMVQLHQAIVNSPNKVVLFQRPTK